MDRRVFLGTLAAGLLAAPLAVEAQQPVKIPRIGFLSPASSSHPRNALTLGALQQGLRELGYLEGQNIAIESRWAEGRYDRLPGLVAELVRLKVDIIATYSAPAIQASQQATATIPIVMGGVIDPVASRFVTSVARPGGNITGLSIMAPEAVEKQLEILKEVVPTVVRVAVLGNPANPGTAPQLRHAQEAARTLKLRLQPIRALGPNDIDRAFAAMTNEGAGAVLVLVDAMFEEHRTRITNLAVTRRLPSVCGLMNFVEAGCLLYYGAHEGALFRRVAILIDKILKGAKPGDLPVEQPTMFALVINMKTAKALGLTIPPSLLARADQVIE